MRLTAPIAESMSYSENGLVDLMRHTWHVEGVYDNSGDSSGRRHSHSMVPGGLLVTSKTTRLTPATSLVMRVEMRSSTS